MYTKRISVLSFPLLEFANAGRFFSSFLPPFLDIVLAWSGGNLFEACNNDERRRHYVIKRLWTYYHIIDSYVDHHSSFLSCVWSQSCLAMKVSLTRGRTSFVLLSRTQTLWPADSPFSLSLLSGYPTLSSIKGEYYSLLMDSLLRHPFPGAMLPWKNLMTVS